MTRSRPGAAPSRPVEPGHLFHRAVTRLHNLAERIRGHAPELHQPTWIEKRDDRQAAEFLAAFRPDDDQKGPPR